MLRLVFDSAGPRRGTRREWLRLGTRAGLGLAGLGMLANRVGGAESPRVARARSVIVVFANGGQSQLDMWDPKPEAPQEVRGEFRPIATAVPGVQFCEHMPRIARVADRLLVVRSMSHEDVDHGSAAYLTLTGLYHPRRSSNPPPSATDAPTFGAVLRRLRPDSKFVSDSIHVNGPALVPRTPGPGQNGGWLGRAYEPLLIGDPTESGGAFPGLAPLDDLPTARLDERLTLKRALDEAARRWDGLPESHDLGRQYRQARDLLASPTARDAFQLDAEPRRVRERYGLHRSGQGLLLARRLVEAGVPYVNVIWNHSNRGQDDRPDVTDDYGWDTHNDIFGALRERLLPRFDLSFSALIEDLDERGLLEETLVVCLGEFGRAPRVALEPKFQGASPGRKHWATVYSIVLAGAGVPRGAVLGASDRLGAEPTTERFGPWDVAATIYQSLGIDPRGHYTDTAGRPLPICQGRSLLD